ncbi:MAG: rRNA maturation RNase YbeY [Bacteroidetes bacterium]|nr:rRNA maturation RNase YbeY [Bacteroidota bacterium]
MKSSVYFHFEDLHFTLRDKRKITQWFNDCCKKEKKELGDLNYIFCSDKYLLKVNKKYLNHDDLTDVITFDNTTPEAVSGDIFISYDRVKDNAKIFGQNRVNELHRVMIHGLLHLIGYSDKNPDQQKVMKSKEDFYLSLRAF